MGCGMGMIKYLMFIFNFVFVLCGLGILVTGVLIHLQLSDYSKVADAHVKFPSLTLIVVGSIIFVIAFFGCCGAIRESHCMTVTFASLLLALLLIQVAVGVYAFVVLKNSDLNVRELYVEMFKNYNDTADREVIDSFQSNFKCCGVDSPSDYPNNVIPWSCCGNPQGQTCTGQIDRIYKKGCVDDAKIFFKKMGTILGSVAIGITGVELIGIIFALCLANSIRNSDRRGYRV